MKSTLLIIILAIAALAFVQFGTGCAPLAGLTLSLDDQGNATISAPLRPLVIPAK